MSLKISFLSN